jgi:hypothetical protein
MRVTKTLKTERFEYECTQLGAFEGRGALLRAQKIAVKGVNGLDAMIDAMSTQDLDFFCSIFGACSRVSLDNGKKPFVKDVFDSHFAGEYFEMVEWLAFNLGLNFGPFFLAIQTKGERIRAATKAAQEPQPEPPSDPSAQ